MSDIIVVGCGRVGSPLATQLSHSDNNVTVIDRDMASLANLGPDFNGATIQGVGFDEDVLTEAGVKTCDAVAAVTQLDNTNLMIAEVCEKLHGVPHVVARLHDPSHERAYSLLGIDYSCGTTLVAQEIYSKLQAGHGNHVKSFGDVEIIQFTLNLRDHMRQTIRAFELERPHGARIVAFERADGSATSIPDSDSILYDGDKLLVCIRSEFLPAFQRYMKER